MNITVRHILLPVDLTPLSDRLVDFARTIAAGLGAKLHLVHVLEEPFTTAGPYQWHLPDTPARREWRYTQARERLARIADELRVKDIDASIEVRGGGAAEEIAKAATDYGADLIVMGTHSRRGLQHLLNGSVTEQVMRRGHWPVLTIHDHGGARAVTAA
jgi:nucleotide-binding universal stress UspA family protein